MCRVREAEFVQLCPESRITRLRESWKEWAELGLDIRVILLPPKHPMPPPLRRLRHCLLGRLRLSAGRERADTLHQIQAQLHPEPVRLPRRELPARFVLGEAAFRGVSGLPYIEWREGTWMLSAGAGEFDDVDGVGARG